MNVSNIDKETKEIKSIPFNNQALKLNKEVQNETNKLDYFNYILTLLRIMIVDGHTLNKGTEHLVKVHKFGNIGEWDSDTGEIYFGALVEFESGNICSIYLDYEGTLKKIKK